MSPERAAGRQLLLPAGTSRRNYRTISMAVGLRCQVSE